MLHKFIASQLDSTKCAHCKHLEVEHFCEVCTADCSVEVRYGTMLMCPSCAEKEDKAQAEANKPENIAARLNNVIAKAREIDDSIEVRTDLFNAHTVAILDLKKAIDDNPSIENKPYALAEELKNRFEHFKTVVFEMNQKIVDAGNAQKAIQVYLNQLANQLRVEEREKLKISDINYKPTVVKPAKVAAIRTASKKFDKKELQKLASELGIDPFTLQMVVVSKGISLEQAGNMLRKSINEAKSEA